MVCECDNEWFECVCVTGSDVSVSVAVSGVILGGMTEWCESVGR